LSGNEQGTWRRGLEGERGVFFRRGGKKREGGKKVTTKTKREMAVYMLRYM
jgi:hypothetical protein